MVTSHTEPEPHPEPAGVPLRDLRPGEVARVRDVLVDGPDADHVRALGLHEDCDLRVCRQAGHCVVQVLGASGGGCRVALDAELAQGVVMTPLTRDGARLTKD